MVGGAIDRGGTPKIFVSSRAEDLKPYRAAARDTAIGAELLPKMMEYFVASGDKPPLPACLDGNTLRPFSRRRVGHSEACERTTNRRGRIST